MTLNLLNDTFPLWIQRQGRSFPQVNDLTRPFLSMINVRYALIELSAPLPPGWKEVSADISMRLVENTHVLPRAFIPRNVTFISNPKEERDAMTQATDFADRAWLYVPGRPEDRANGPGRVSVVRNKSGIDATVTMQRPGFVVISEAAWSGWRAYVDNRRVKELRANHAFLGVYVPAGTHSVRLRYLPQSFVLGRAISLITLAGLWSAVACHRFLLPRLAAAAVRRARKRRHRHSCRCARTRVSVPHDLTRDGD